MISRRGLEATTAVLTGAFGAVVSVSSLENGVAWSTAGVDAGTFPFFIGLIILAGSLFNLARGWFGPRESAIDWYQLKRVTALFLPAVVYIGVIPLIGMYVASGGYVLGTLALQNRVTVTRASVIAIITAVSLYLVFERMFQVTLPRGALGDVLGF
jgi:small-conductance mechanosensitive channel